MTQREKANQLIEWIDAYDDECCQNVGGYPAVTILLDRHVVRASITHDGEPELDYWTLKEAAKWHDEIVAMKQEQHPELDETDYIGETWPSVPALRQ